jgi:glycosyltransferase involved in cell wall biosynthesis
MAKETIMLLCYWGLQDGLTQGAVMPHLQVLNTVKDIKEVLLVTLERGEGHQIIPKSSLLPEKVQHWPIYLKLYRLNLFTKIADFVVLPKQLVQLCKQENIQFIVAYGALSGALGYKVWLKEKIPFCVSSFEPHADYMMESNVWKKKGLKYIFQKRWEKLQKNYAAALMPVTENYKKQLLEEGVSGARVFVVPCTVDLLTFKFDNKSRRYMRLHLNCEDATIGIYVGKYGGLYYEQEAFYIYKRCFNTIQNFRLIILSPQPQEEIVQYLEQHQIDKSKVYIASAPHAEVPQYLSAADFAFATIKSYPSARYCSPVKIGEYWANGLPVLLTEGVGDDSSIIQREGGGATFNLQEEGSLESALEQIQQILKDPNHRQEIPKLAQKYRSPERIREAYEYFFKEKREDGA